MQVTEPEAAKSRLNFDRERTLGAKLQKELDAATQRTERMGADQRQALETVQVQLGDARHQAGVLQGRLDAIQAENSRLQMETVMLRETVTRVQGVALPNSRPPARKPVRAGRAASAPQRAARRKKTL